MPPPPTAEELAKLRKLTPEQEAANAAAAKHIGKVAARMEGVPAQERKPAMDPYDETKTLWDCFEGGLVEAALLHTPLVDLCGRVLMRAAGFGEGASLRALPLVASCHLRVGPVVGEGQAGPREVPPALRKLWGSGLAPARRCGDLGCRACVYLYGVWSASPRVRRPLGRPLLYGRGDGGGSEGS